MKIVNRMIKAIAYVAVLAWVFFGLYLFALLATSAVAGLAVSIFSLFTKSIPLVIQNNIGWIVLVVSIPVTFILYLTSYYRAKKQSKQLMESMHK